MKKKYILIPLAVIVISLIGVIIYTLSTFSLFDNNSQLIEEIEMPDYIVKIYYVPSDATIQDAVVVMKSEHGNESLISKFDRYYMLKTYKLINSDSLELVLVDKDLKPSHEYITIIALPK